MLYVHILAFELVMYIIIATNVYLTVQIILYDNDQALSI